MLFTVYFDKRNKGLEVRTINRTEIVTQIQIVAPKVEVLHYLLG